VFSLICLSFQDEFSCGAQLRPRDRYEAELLPIALLTMTSMTLSRAREPENESAGERGYGLI
jgi:hypothetical protein